MEVDWIVLGIHLDVLLLEDENCDNFLEYEGRIFKDGFGWEGGR